MTNEQKPADIGELVMRLELDVRVQRKMGEPIDGALVEQAARALTALEARCAELEKQIETYDVAFDGIEPIRDRIEREPVVKPLEWKPTHGGKWLRASAVGFTYEVRANDSRIEEKMARAQAQFDRQILSALASAPERVEPEPGPMTPEEHRLEDLKQMAAYAGPIVSFEATHPYYLASCDKCGWVGSSEFCGTDYWGDDSDVYCPRCHSSGADCGKVAEKIEASARHASPPTPVVTDALRAAQEALSSLNEWFAQREDGKATTNSEETMFAKTSQIDALIEAALASREAT